MGAKCGMAIDGGGMIRVFAEHRSPLRYGKPTAMPIIRAATGPFWDRRPVSPADSRRSESTGCR
jgi:hypothetical protein